MDWQKIRMARLLCLNGSIPTHWTMSNTSMTLTVQNHYS
jgi:ribosomal protein L39E